MARTAYYWDAISLEHDNGPHVESIARAERLHPRRIAHLVPGIEAPPIEKHDAAKWIETVHHPRYRVWVETSCAEGRRLLDQGDTVVCLHSYDCAVACVDAALTAADAVMSGAADNAFCAMRPPGHHALPEAAMGFCLFANVAICARYLQMHHGLDRIAIVDWDVHHGNGTQEIFYRDSSVLFVSLHQHPLWPGSGMPDERGTDAGEGYTINIPIAPATPESDYLAAFESKVLPALWAYQPAAVLISAGFDAHKADPLGGLLLTEQGFSQMTHMLKELARDCCAGRIISCLEGGYNLPALEASVAAHLRALME